MASSLARVLGVGTMTLTLAMGLQPLGCASDSTSPPLTLANNWVYTTNNNYDATGLTVTKENTYAMVRVSQTSATTLNSEIERGTIAVAGANITFTPEQWTCQEKTDPAYVAGFQIQGDTLSLAFASGIILMKLNTVPAGNGGSTGVSLTNGCFLKGGFVRSPLTPVGSCGEGGESCSAPDATCCNGFACNNGGLCSAICSANTECKSGCCPQAATPGNLRLCAPATACK